MTPKEFHTLLTPEQRKAMHDLHSRSGENWDSFLAQATPPSGSAVGDYVGIPDFCGMFVGIERDGHAHS